MNKQLSPMEQLIEYLKKQPDSRMQDSDYTRGMEAAYEDAIDKATELLTSSSKVEDEINRLQKEYDENGYDCPPDIKLQRIEQHFLLAIDIYKKQLEQSKVVEAEGLYDAILKAINPKGERGYGKTLAKKICDLVTTHREHQEREVLEQVWNAARKATVSYDNIHYEYTDFKEFILSLENKQPCD